jgi:hypothetical protein
MEVLTGTVPAASTPFDSPPEHGSNYGLGSDGSAPGGLTPEQVHQITPITTELAKRINQIIRNVIDKTQTQSLLSEYTSIEMSPEDGHLGIEYYQNMNNDTCLGGLEKQLKVFFNNLSWMRKGNILIIDCENKFSTQN